MALPPFNPPSRQVLAAHHIYNGLRDMRETHHPLSRLNKQTISGNAAPAREGASGVVPATSGRGRRRSASARVSPIATLYARIPKSALFPQTRGVRTDLRGWAPWGGVGSKTAGDGDGNARCAG